MAKNSHDPEPDRHHYCRADEIDLEGLAELFFCTKEKIRLAHTMGVITACRIHVKLFFKRDEAIKSLEPYVKNGILTLKKRNIQKAIKPL